MRTFSLMLKNLIIKKNPKKKNYFFFGFFFILKFFNIKGNVRKFYMGGPRNRHKPRNTVYIIIFSVPMTGRVNLMVSRIGQQWSPMHNPISCYLLSFLVWTFTSAVSTLNIFLVIFKLKHSKQCSVPDCEKLTGSKFNPDP